MKWTRKCAASESPPPSPSPWGYHLTVIPFTGNHLFESQSVSSKLLPKHYTPDRYWTWGRWWLIKLVKSIRYCPDGQKIRFIPSLHELFSQSNMLNGANLSKNHASKVRLWLDIWDICWSQWDFLCDNISHMVEWDDFLFNHGDIGHVISISKSISNSKFLYEYHEPVQRTIGLQNLCELQHC